MRTVEIPKEAYIIIPRLYQVWFDKYAHLEEDDLLDFMDGHSAFQLCEKEFTNINIRMEYDDAFLVDSLEFIIELSPDTIFYSIKMRYKNNAGERVYVKPDEFDEKFCKEFKLKYEYCDCYKEIYKNGVCEECFIYDYTHDDKCCICLDNGGRWVQFECKHVMHYGCSLKLDKCPLCRKHKNVITQTYPYTL